MNEFVAIACEMMIYQNFQQPHPGAVVENWEWIDEIKDEEYHKSQGTGIWRDGEEFTVEESQHVQGPQYSQKGRQL